uniref:Uncharacterized protein n=1 Tax=Micrurus lemniscatus lemniscatus TaxID=129467 RepID=A0A2D4IK74_MICLE
MTSCVWYMFSLHLLISHHETVDYMCNLVKSNPISIPIPIDILKQSVFTFCMQSGISLDSSLAETEKCETNILEQSSESSGETHLFLSKKQKDKSYHLGLPWTGRDTRWEQMSSIAFS